MPKPELIDVTMRLHHETDKAILVSDDGDWDKANWIPKSQVEIEPLSDGTITLTFPVWLAKDKGLI